jgi:hypothetical protein
LGRWQNAGVEKVGSKIALQSDEPLVQGRVLKLKLARAAALSLTARANRPERLQSKDIQYSTLYPAHVNNLTWACTKGPARCIASASVGFIAAGTESI